MTGKKYNTTLEIVFDLFFFFPMPFPYWEYIFCKEILTMYSINFSTTVALKFVRHLNSA